MKSLAASSIVVFALTAACEDTNLSLSSVSILSSADALDFGEVYVGRSTTRTLALSNRNAAPRRITSTSVDRAAGFDLDEDIAGNAGIPGGGTLAIELAFSPRAEGISNT